MPEVQPDDREDPRRGSPALEQRGGGGDEFPPRRLRPGFARLDREPVAQPRQRRRRGARRIEVPGHCLEFLVDVDEGALEDRQEPFEKGGAGLILLVDGREIPEVRLAREVGPERVDPGGREPVADELQFDPQVSTLGVGQERVLRVRSVHGRPVDAPDVVAIRQQLPGPFDPRLRAGGRNVVDPLAHDTGDRGRRPIHERGDVVDPGIPESSAESGTDPVDRLHVDRLVARRQTGATLGHPVRDPRGRDVQRLGADGARDRLGGLLDELGEPPDAGTPEPIGVRRPDPLDRLERRRFVAVLEVLVVGREVPEPDLGPGLGQFELGGDPVPLGARLPRIDPGDELGVVTVRRRVHPALRRPFEEDDAGRLAHDGVEAVRATASTAERQRETRRCLGDPADALERLPPVAIQRRLAVRPGDRADDR